MQWRFLLLVALCVALLAAADGFSFFGRGGGRRRHHRSSDSMYNSSQYNSSQYNSSRYNSSRYNSSSISTTRTVKLLLREVDDETPYFSLFMFRVPLELNYALPEGSLKQEFSDKIREQRNISSGVKRIVRNDLVLMETDFDVWKLRTGDRIEVWSEDYGRPTRAKTMMAWAKGAFRMGGGRGGRGRGKGGRRRGRGRGRGRSGDDEEFIPVPEFEEQDD